MEFVALRIAMLAASGAVAAPLAADEVAGITPMDGGGEVQVVATSRPAELAEIDFRRFFLRSAQLGVPAQSLGLSLDISANDDVTECRFSRSFRHAFTALELCDQIKRTATFRPAVDAQGNAVASIYANRMDLQSWYLPRR